MADVTLLGVFEDAAQRDFVGHLVVREFGRAGCEVFSTWRLTDGCNFRYLNDHLNHADDYHGVIIGVDGKKMQPDRKATFLAERAQIPETVPVLYSVACPSIEAWMMSDPQALPQALQDQYGFVNSTHRPAHVRAEGQAKLALARWTEALLGEPLLLGGREHAPEVAKLTEVDRLSSKRTPELIALLRVGIPGFIRSCQRR